LARKRVNDSKVAYILGYGFDENNNHRIGIENRWRSDAKRAVMFTNYGDINWINKQASKCFFGTPNKLIESQIHGTYPEQYVEKSTRTVYDALNLDFDALEGA
jgi:hypothetical protein